MSALGQKQTLRHCRSMSALPPKADIAERDWHVRFVPKADIAAQPTDRELIHEAFNAAAKRAARRRYVARPRHPRPI